MSPIYCDNRKALSYPTAREYIKEQLSEKIIEKYGKKIDVIAGVATSGIAFGTLVADKLGLPFVYVRPTPKTHGLGKQIEGDIFPDQNVVVVEDLISTGQSCLNVVKAIRDADCYVLGVAAIFTYGFEMVEILFTELACHYFTLSNYDILIEKAQEDKYISPEDMELLKAWKENPQGWNKK